MRFQLRIRLRRLAAQEHCNKVEWMKETIILLLRYASVEPSMIHYVRPRHTRCSLAYFYAVIKVHETRIV
jgi:hypothetical protein